MMAVSLCRVSKMSKSWDAISSRVGGICPSPLTLRNAGFGPVEREREREREREKKVFVASLQKPTLLCSKNFDLN